jgi:hypothetical protein
MCIAVGFGGVSDRVQKNVKIERRIISRHGPR